MVVSSGFWFSSLRAQRRAVIPGWSEGPDLRCAIAHRGISRFRVRCFASPRNDRSSRRQNRAFDFAKADAIAVGRAPAAHDKGIAIFEKRPDDAARQLDRLGAVPADFKKAAALVL